MQRRTLLAVAVLAAIPLVASCTPEEFARWQALQESDPAAAAAVADSLTEPAVPTEPAVRTAPAASTAPAEPPIGTWDDLAQCESGGDWSINTGNGYYGGLQFSPSSWRAVGGTGLPHEHPRAEQIHRGELLLDVQGWGAWPTCSSKLGLR